MNRPSPTEKGPPQANDAAPKTADSPPASPDLRGEVFDDWALDKPMKFLPLDKKWATGWGFTVLVLAFCVFLFGGYVANKSKKPAPIGPFNNHGNSQTVLRVQVEGQVKAPGVYELPGGSRVEDAIQKAGGALPGANCANLNLADWVADGTKIEVPSASPTAVPTATAAAPVATSPIPTSALPATNSGAPASASSNAPQPANAPTIADPTPDPQSKSSDTYLAELRQNPINLNTADAVSLCKLPGVGPKMAERILAYRQQTGGFKRLEDLDGIKGIGGKRLDALREFVTFQ